MKNIIKDKRGIAILPLLLFIALPMIIIYFIAHLPQICLLGWCWTPIHKTVAKIMDFYLVVIAFVLLQVGIVWGYYYIFRGAFINIGTIIKRFRDWSFRIERFIYLHSGR